MLPPSVRRFSLASSLASALALLAVIVATGTGCGVPLAEEAVPTECPAAANEPNDTEETAEDLGELSDDPDSARGVTSSVHTSTDRDWYRVHIVDRGLGGDPEVNVVVPSGFEVTTWFVCDDRRTTATECSHGSSDYVRVGGVEGCRGARLEGQTTPEGSTIMSPDVMASSTTDCSGTSSDDGTLYIRVDRTSSAGKTCTYDLTIDVK